MIVAVFVVLRLLVWDTATIGMVLLVEVSTILVMADVNIIVAGTIFIVLEFALPVPYSIDASSSAVVVKLFTNALAGVILAVLASIDVELMPDSSANAFAVAMTALEFPVPTPLEECR